MRQTIDLLAEKAFHHAKSGAGNINQPPLYAFY
jgi:hypothetical protein